MRWFRVEDRKPEDGQTVLGRWTSLLSNQQPTFESVTYHAWDADDGPEAWHNAWGEQTDAPGHWLPPDALPAVEGEDIAK
jgi:hypothetical protein